MTGLVPLEIEKKQFWVQKTWCYDEVSQSVCRILRYSKHYMPIAMVQKGNRWTIMSFSCRRQVSRLLHVPKKVGHEVDGGVAAQKKHKGKQHHRAPVCAAPRRPEFQHDGSGDVRQVSEEEM